MVRTLVISIIALIGLVWLTWNAQARLNALRLFEDTREIARTDAMVTEVMRGGMQDDTSPWVRIELSYEVDGQKYGRTMVDGVSHFTVKKGQKVQVTYLKRTPQTALLDFEMKSLPSQVKGMQILVFCFGLTAIVIPFTIAGFGRRRQKKNVT